jgi:hypothetical protein
VRQPPGKPDELSLQRITDPRNSDPVQSAIPALHNSQFFLGWGRCPTGEILSNVFAKLIPSLSSGAIVLIAVAESTAAVQVPLGTTEPSAIVFRIVGIEGKESQDGVTTPRDNRPPIMPAL